MFCIWHINCKIHFRRWNALAANSEAVAQKCSVKKVFLEISQNSQENNRGQSLSCNKVAGPACNFIKKETLARPSTLLKKRLWHRCFPVNFEKFLRTPFLIEHLWWLLLLLLCFAVHMELLYLLIYFCVSSRVIILQLYLFFYLYVLW